MARSKSSNRWLQEHADDEFVQKAARENYRSRAVYKLIELHEKYHLLRPGISVVELGAAPGGWTQYIAEVLAGRGTIIATDILHMDGFEQVEFVQGDFSDDDVVNELKIALKGESAQLVLSDLAPNLSGVAVTDQARSMYLAELALDLALEILGAEGSFVTKLFQGEGFDPFVAELRQKFSRVNIHKPLASRSRSREVYAVARKLVL